MAEKEASPDTEQDKKEVKAKRLHNKLLYTTIAIDYLHRTVEKGIPEQRFRANCRNYVDEPLFSSVANVSQLIEILEKKGLIGLGDYDILVEIISFDVRIVQEVEDTKALLHTLGFSLYRRKQLDKTTEFIEDYTYRCKYIYKFHLQSRNMSVP